MLTDRSVIYDTQCVGWAPTAKACHDAAYYADAFAMFDPSVYKSITSRSPIVPGSTSRASASAPAISSSSAAAASTLPPAHAAGTASTGIQVKLEPIDEAAEDGDDAEGAADASISSITSTSVEVEEEALDSDCSSDSASEIDYDSDWQEEYPTDVFARASASASTSSTAPAPAPSLTARTPLNLRVHRLYVPHGDSFPILHVHLHQPETPLFPVLLGLPLYVSSAQSPACAPVLAAMPMAEIMAKFEGIRGFWSNVCALGVGADRTWNGMGEAWAALSAEMRRRAEVEQRQ